MTIDRLNLEMPAEVKKRLEEIRDETLAANLAQVVQRALSVYDFVLKEKKQGRELVIKDGNVERPVILL